jgi:hypothetical protein
MEKIAESLIEFKEKLAEWERGVMSPDDLAAIPVLVEDLAGTCPPSGQGVHHWFAQAAYVLCVRWPFCEHLSLEEAHDTMEEAALDQGRTPKPGEIWEAIDFVLGRGGKFKSAQKPLPPVNKALERKAAKFKPKKKAAKFKPEAVLTVDVVAAAAEILADESPVREPWSLSSYQPLLWRFPVETPICFGWDRYSNHVRKLDPGMEGRNLPPLMVPNAWVGRLCKRDCGIRAFENFDGQWWYQVNDFDKGSLDEQASKIQWLREAKGSPELKMVLLSGKRGFHAWWDVREFSGERREEFFALAVSIGADPAHQSINQLVRTPNSVRIDTGRKQGVVYLA